MLIVYKSERERDEIIKFSKSTNNMIMFNIEPFWGYLDVLELKITE